MPDFNDLEALVRAARPAPDPAWAAKLDGRVAARFAKPSRQWSFNPMLIPAGGLVALILVVVVVAAVLGGGSGSSNSSSDASGVAKVLSAPPEASSKSSSGAASSAPVPSVVAQDRAVERDVSITLSAPADSVQDVSDRAMHVADSLGGFVQDSSVTAGHSAQITLRVPQDKLDTALSQLSRLAHVRSRTESSQDVTDQRDALQSSVRDARAYRDSLRTRLAHATTDRQAASLRGRLARAEQTLRNRERQLAALAHETSLATISVQVQAARHAAAAPAKGRWTPGDAFHDAGRVLEVIAGVAVIALAVALPLAIVAACAALLARLYGRWRRERALELA